MVDVWDTTLSMLFAALEGFAVYALMLYVFRFDLKNYIWHALVIVTLSNLQGHFMSGTELSYTSPLINIVFSVLFMRFVVQLPLIGALASVIIGYFGYALLQFLVIIVMFGSLEGLNDANLTRWQVQLITGVIGIVFARLLYKFGIGFTNDFDKFKFPLEKQIMTVLAVLFSIGLSVVLYSENLIAAGIFFMVAMFIFVYYAMRKEAEE